MKKSGWTLAKKCELLPSGIAFSHTTTTTFLDGSDRPVDEIVFVSSFGRRHGYQLFCDAISKLSSSRYSPTIHDTRVLRQAWRKKHSGGMAAALRPQLALFRSDAAMDIRRGHLAVSGRAQLPAGWYLHSLANQPALLQQCLNAGIPVVATNVGGIPEMVDPAHHKRCLAEPTAQALASKIKAALKKRPKRANPTSNGRTAQRPGHDTSTRCRQKPHRPCLTMTQ